LSVSRHLRVRTSGYDLGIFEQAIRGYARLRAPIAELKGPGFHLLGDHFHPILAVLGPIYRLFPSPITLLVAQAALLALSAVPVTRLAIHAVGPRAGAGIGVVYGLSWGIQQAVGFDFHEICFAVPLLAFSLECLAHKRWRCAVAWAVPLILVKEDLPLTLAAIGGYLLLRRQWALGGAVIILAASSLALIVGVIIPGFHIGHTYVYTDSVQFNAQNPLARLVQPWDVKTLTIGQLLAPTAFVALRSPLLLIALPTIGWRFWSTNPSYWSTGFHYSAILMPIVFVAFIDGLDRMRTSPRHQPRRYAAAAVPLALAVTIALCPLLPMRDLVNPAYWRAGAAAAQTRAVLDLIPDDASVAATNMLAPQLTARCRVLLFPTFPDADGLRPEWIALTDPPDTSLKPAADITAQVARLPSLGYRMVVHRDGVILWRR
jgi:uncharacterized membrane protein